VAGVVRRRRVVPGLEEAFVKKLIVLVLLTAAGAVAWRKVQSDRAEQALWAEVTDPVT
jgi:predicted negative regulator of RcsB-dependent stress response